MSYISRRALVAGSGALLLPKRARAVVMMPNTFNLAFPGGRAPGFDPTHVALSNGGTCRFSGAVASNGGHINILTGKQASSFLGTVAPSFNFGIPWYKFSNAVATRESFTSGVNLATDTPFMMGVIAYALVTSTSQALFFFGSTTTGYSVSFTSSGTINPQVGTGNAGATAPAYSANVPYFICWGRQGTGTNQGFMLVVRLDTGKVITAQTFTSSAAVTTPTGVLIGQTTAGGGGGVSAVAYIGGGFPTLQIAEAWALDPWSFWYPNRLQDLTQ